MLIDLRSLVCALVASVCLAVLAAGAAVVHAQPAVAGDTGTLTVGVVDTQGKAVAGANVVLFFEGDTAGQGTTNAFGKVTFEDLEAGEYEIFASKVTMVFGFPIATYGTGSATVTAGGHSGTVVVLNRFAP